MDASQPILASGAHDFATKPYLVLTKRFVSSTKLATGKVQIWHSSGRSWQSSLSANRVLGDWQAVAADLKLAAEDVIGITAIKRTGLLITQLTPGSAGGIHQRGTVSRSGTPVTELASLPALDQTLEAESQSLSSCFARHTVEPPLPTSVVLGSVATAAMEGAQEEGGRKETQAVIRRRAVMPEVPAGLTPPGQHPLVVHVHESGVWPTAPPVAKPAKPAAPAVPANTAKSAKRKREASASTSKVNSHKLC